MNTVKFVFAIHAHQPVGNFDFVFADSYKRCYHPCLSAFYEYPQFKFCLHYSGILFEWIERHFPGHIKMIKEMVQRGQLELLSGGYYEPVLAIIPDEDKVEQIEMLSKTLENCVGAKPTGMWLAERVWEPHLPASMSRAGIEYVVVDDNHFRYAGLQDHQLDGYYIAEETGSIVRIFPSSKFLRYSIPFKDVPETVDYIMRLCNKAGNPVVVYADDAEKFGIWPGTHKLCYEKKWLPNFIETVIKCSDIVQTAHFSEVINSIKPRGNIFLPTASYAEMMEWSLPARATVQYQDFEKRLEKEGLMDKYGIFVRGGFWRNFLSKYPEANNLNKKMLWIDQKIKQARDNTPDPKNQSILDEANRGKLAGQCNDSYWHGVFGGLYLNNLRSSVYQHLIAAEKLVDKAVHNDSTWIEAKKFDIDRDGNDEFIVETPYINIYLSPLRGGTIYELDYKKNPFNFLNTVTRREEAYHRQILENLAKKPAKDDAASIHDMIQSKEKGLEKLLHYDRYRRTFLIDHFMSPSATLEKFSACDYSEIGDFVEGEYLLETDGDEESLKIILSRQGTVGCEEGSCQLTVRKVITIPNNSASMEIKYTLTSGYDKELPLWFGCECNLSMLDGESADRYYFVAGRKVKPRNLSSIHKLPAVEIYGIKDSYLNTECRFELSSPADLWLFPIHTVSLSEGGFEKVYQSSVLMPNWQLILAPNEERKFRIWFEIGEL